MEIQNWFEKLITHPLQNWWSEKLENLKYNSIDLIEVVAIVLIVSFSLKIILFNKDKEKNISVIYFTLIFYTIIRLYWRVVLNV